VREYLQALEESNPVAPDAAEPAESSTPPKIISLSYPASGWTAAPGGPAFFAYSTNYPIDLEAGIIMDVEATPANRSQEIESTKTMIDRVEQRLCLKPARLAGDTAYGTAEMLGWMVDHKGIAPHVPVWERYARKDDTFSTSEFKWNEMVNEYRCPAGNALRSERRQPKNSRTHVTKAAQFACHNAAVRFSAGAIGALASLERTARCEGQLHARLILRKYVSGESKFCGRIGPT
jgi:hypothetical protein